MSVSIIVRQFPVSMVRESLVPRCSGMKGHFNVISHETTVRK